MHIPDGLIPLWQVPIYFIIILIVGYFAIRWAKENLDERNVPLIAALSAGIFAIQTLNMAIPVFMTPLGISGHVVGAALVAIIFRSPYAGFLVMTTVLIIQAFLFGDGGITALGANIFNMGVIGSGVGYYGYKLLKKPLSELSAVFIGAWASIFVAAIFCTLELYLAGVFPLKEALILMGSYHFIIGIFIEGIITVIVYSALKKVRPDIIRNEAI